MNEGDPKNKVKEALMFKLKGLSNNNPAPKPEYQMPMQQPQMQMQMQMPQQQPPMKIDTEEDFRKMPYEGKAKYDNELKALNALKNETEERSQRPKKMFFEHYDTEEPYCPIIQNNSNPSGRPPNIPPQMYEGITVKPKRPWVYLGTENLPPVEYQEINQSSFRNIAKKNMEAKEENKNRRLAQAQNGPPAPTGPPKPRKKVQKPQQPEQNSDLDISDEIVEEGESIFASQSHYNTQTMNNKKSKMSSMRNSERSYLGEDYSMSEGTETRNKGVEVFGSDEDDQGDDSGMFSKSKSKNQQKGKKDAGKGRKKDDFSDEDQ